jgi:membrane-associated protease RseP (regulator of RpoE activity)
MPYLALILFLPWFLVLGALFWLLPRQPRNARRKAFDMATLVVALALSFAGMRVGYALGAADLASGAIWKQVLATLVAYGAFLFALTLAVPLRGWWLGRDSR